MVSEEGSLEHHRSDLWHEYNLATLKQDYPISEAAAKEQQAPVKANFPFGRLPPELQLNVIRFAMPENGLRPLPLPGLDFPEVDKSLTKYSKTLRREQHAPQSLFRANKWLSSEAVKIFYNEVKFRIDVEPTGLRFMDEAYGNEAIFRSHTMLKRFPPFRRQRNIELYIILNADTFPECFYEPHCYHLKEWLRLIADALVINPKIDSLAVYVPCSCGYVESDHSESDHVESDPSKTDLSKTGPSETGPSETGPSASGPDEPELSKPGLWDSDGVEVTISQITEHFDFLTPLNRLFVHKSTSFLPLRDGKHSKGRGPCLRSGCQEMMKYVQHCLGMEHLNGEKLNEREKVWKRLKFDTTRKFYCTENRLFYQVWECLDDRDDDVSFEEAVQELREYLPTRWSQ
ncbi:MAG: hypothetical protein LQ346_006429 [Caloplaca aetnensis]|nr:MAG: hypothetical protein LQ346_006429 [Caloplaca aetnensis]